ncbi:MAG: AraC family transcriptional regulator, partial [Bacteroidota bacterium]
MITKKTSEYYQLPILDGLELLNAKSHTLDFPFHTHSTFNITIALDTAFSIKLNDKLLKAPKGTLSITNPNEVHATPCDHD